MVPLTGPIVKRLPMSVGKRLKAERERASPTQAAFIAAVGVAKSQQIRFENDENLPGGAYLIAAAALGVDVQYVLTGVRSLNHASPRIQRVAETFAALERADQDEAQKMVTAKASGATEQRNLRMLALYESGKSFAEIGRMFGISGPRVGQIVHALENKARRKQAKG